VCVYIKYPPENAIDLSSIPLHI